MGKGIVRIQAGIFPGVDKPVTLEDWYRMLLLPENYGVIDLHEVRDLSSNHCDIFLLTVESDEIYAVPGDILPTVVLHHALVENRACLDRIEIDYREVLRTGGVV
jgi:hypothetical protein